MDEEISHNNGIVTLKYLGLKINPSWVAAHREFDRFDVPLPEYFDRDYGVAFETPVAFLERLLHLDDVREQFLFRHLCTFLVCFGGLIAVYQLAARRFQDWRIGLLATLWLLLSPRLFADSFYNDKDAVFMALFAIAINTGILFLLQPTAKRLVWHALACAVMIDVRIMGVLIPLATLALFVWQGVRRDLAWHRVATASLAYILLLSGLIVLFWPYLWPSPIENFAAAFRKMSTFRWPGSVLYFGENIPATELPWHYAPVWIGITTPILYLVTGVVGTGLIIGNIVRHTWRLWGSKEQLQDVMFLGLFAGPIAAVIILHSVLYDGWRQLYFVYPAFILIAIRGWLGIIKSRAQWNVWPKIVYGTTALSLIGTAAQMVRDHPFQNAYFNLLVGPRVIERFEVDYWGVGYQQDLAYIATHDERAGIKVYCPGPTPARMALMMLPNEQRWRLTIVDDPSEADYCITDYRGHPYPYPYPHEVYQIRADGRVIHSVFKLRW